MIDPFLTHMVSVHNKVLGPEDTHGNATETYTPLLSAPDYNTKAFMEFLGGDRRVSGEDVAQVRKWRMFLLPTNTSVKDNSVIQWQGKRFMVDEHGVGELFDGSVLHHKEVVLTELSFQGNAQSAP